MTETEISISQVTIENVNSFIDHLSKFPELQGVGPEFFEREKVYTQYSKLLRQKVENGELTWDKFDLLIGTALAAKEWLSEKDFLTGLGNVRAYQQKLDERIAESKRYDIPFTLIEMDVDNFKSLNDEKGHPAGDEFLRKLAEAIIKNKRKEDDVFRVGGDEIKMILPHISVEKAETLVNRLNDAIEQVIKSSELFSSTTKSLGVSFGKAEWIEEESIEQLEKKVDEDLYRVKRAKKEQLKKNG